jgi:N-acetylmuramoyl-L-alanine amidase
LLTIDQPATVNNRDSCINMAQRMYWRIQIPVYYMTSQLLKTALFAFFFVFQNIAHGYAENGQHSATSNSTTIAFAARIAGDDNRTRLVVDFDQKIGYKTLFLENPNRLVIDLPDTVFNFSKDQQKALYGLVAGFRYGAIAPGRSRIVLQTKSPTRIDKSSLEPHGNNGHHRLMLDIIKTDAESYRNAIFLQSGDFGNSGNVAYKGDRIRRNGDKNNKITIVIDPGHGGIDGGAEGKIAGVEKNITLDFAMKLKHELEQSSLLRVMLTRNEDTFVSLSERVSFAQRNQADLMISLHADTLRQKQIRGATIYTLSQKGSDNLANYLANKENRSDLVAGLALPQENSQVTDILIELTRRETKSFSLQIARHLVSQLKGRIKLIKNPLRAANFHVLRAPEVPSVLIELGYLSNVKDAQQLSSAKWQQTTAEHVKSAIMNYLRPRIAGGLN